MKQFNSKDTFNVGTHGENPTIIKVVPFYEEWEDSIGEIVSIDDESFEILEAKLNKCHGFAFCADEELEHRDIWLKVKKHV